MHPLPVTHALVLPSPARARRLRLALTRWAQRQWLARCAQAERPTRRVPRY